MFSAVSSAFGRNFLIAHVVPAALLVSFIVVTFVSDTGELEKKHLSSFGINRALAVLFGILVVAVLFSQFSRWIIRVFEGYEGSVFKWAGLVLMIVPLLLLAYGPSKSLPLRWREMLVGAVCLAAWGAHWPLKRVHEKRHDRLTEAIKEIETQDPDEQHTEKQRTRQVKQRQLMRFYPNREYILPTRLGNTLRAAEFYPYRLYRIEPISAWPKLASVVPEAYAKQVAEQETNFVFVLNLTVVGIAIAVNQFFFLDNRIAISALASFVLYLVSCSAALQWGEYMRSVFDLYHLDLLKQLGVHLPPTPMTLQQQRRTWRLVQTPMIYGWEPPDDLTFQPRTWSAAEIQAVEDRQEQPAPRGEETAFKLKILGLEFTLSRSVKPAPPTAHSDNTDIQ